MSEDFRTKSQIYADRLEREHTDPEPIEIRPCRHCDEHTEPVNTREVLTKSHGAEATKALLEEFEGWDLMCGDCARPYEMPDHVLLDFQQERIGLAPLNHEIEVLRGTVETGAEWLANKAEALRQIYERSLESNAGSLVVAIGEIAKGEIFSVDQKKIEKRVRLRELRKTVQIFEESEAPSTRLDVTALFTDGPAPEGLREAIRGFGKPKKGTIGELTTRMAKEELAEAEQDD